MHCNILEHDQRLRYFGVAFLLGNFCPLICLITAFVTRYGCTKCSGLLRQCMSRESLSQACRLVNLKLQTLFQIFT